MDEGKGREGKERGGGPGGGGQNIDTVGGREVVGGVRETWGRRGEEDGRWRGEEREGQNRNGRFRSGSPFEKSVGQSHRADQSSDKDREGCSAAVDQLIQNVAKQ